MTKYIYLFYILLGVCLLAGFGSAFGSGQEHDVVRTIDLENSAVALCSISEAAITGRKKINNGYHFYKVGIGGAALLLFLFAPCTPPKFCELIPLLRLIAKLARFLNTSS